MCATLFTLVHFSDHMLTQAISFVRLPVQDDCIVEQKPDAQKSKSAKKNERRKNKKNLTDIDVTLDGGGGESLESQLAAQLDDTR